MFRNFVPEYAVKKSQKLTNFIQKKPCKYTSINNKLTISQKTMIYEAKKTLKIL